jgi:hypothetical protein
MITHLPLEWQESHGAHLMEMPGYRLQLVVLEQADGASVTWVLEANVDASRPVVAGIVDAGGETALRAAKIQALEAVAAYGDRLARLMREERAKLVEVPA